VPTPVARLTSLSLEAVGGILLVTQQVAPDGTKTEPYIFAREPTSHFRVEVLAPLQLPQAPLLILKSTHAYVTGLFSHLGVHGKASLYSAACFTAANLHMFLAVNTWTCRLHRVQVPNPPPSTISSSVSQSSRALPRYCRLLA
jgi:hypothetical protein